MNDIQPRPYWSSMTSYLLVTTGAVVGLGNFIFFPFYVYKFGGLFVLFYIFCELFISIPILFAELLIGRRGKQNPVGSFEILSMETDTNRRWRFIGWVCLLILFLSVANYTVIASTPALHFIESLRAISETAAGNNVITLEICLLVFLFITMLVILRGINRGLETISRITVPLYFFILLGLAIYSCSIGNFTKAIEHLFDFTPDDSIITVLFVALIYAFLKLKVGMGSMIVYGSYLPYSVPLGYSTVLIVCFDAVISLLAYFVIAPLSLPPETFVSTVSSYQEALYAFLQNNHYHILTVFFYFAAIIAAWTPTIAMAESATVTLIERFDLSRRTATFLVFACAALIGTTMILSTTIFIHHWTFAAFINGLTTHILIPISAFLTAIFAGWILKRSITMNELGFNPKIYRIWLFLMRWAVPIFIVIIAIMLWSR
jgi:NSS family neurotransmitter:Na+ symporter